MSIKLTIKNSWNKLRYYFSFLLLVFYLTIAFLFLFSDIWVEMIPKGRGLIGFVLLLFGILRFYVAFRRYKSKDERIQKRKKEYKTTETQIAQKSTETAQ